MEGLSRLVNDFSQTWDPGKDLSQLIKELEKQMRSAADVLDFELAAALRDKIRECRQMSVVSKKKSR